jgi:hypothetical protein
MMNKALLFAIVVATGCLGACATSSFVLRDANDALNGYYTALQQSSKENDWGMAEQTRMALDTLATDTAAQAAKEKDPRNGIAFYRVATTAAWQSGSDDVIAYAGKGEALCDADGNANRAPRDCAMLKLIPTLASVDQTTRDLDRLTGQLASTTTAEQRRPFIPDAEKIFADYRNSLASLLAARTGIAASPVPPEFVQTLDDNLGNLLCNKLEIDGVGVVAQVRGNVAAARCGVWEQKKKALDNGLSAHCLPASGSSADLERPAGC